MVLVKVSAINGLGKTKGALAGAQKLIEAFDDREEIDVGENLEEQVEKIEAGAREYLELMEKPLFIGGDHSISFPCAKAFISVFGKDSKIIVFDAHPDLMPPMLEPTHEEWLRALLERTGLPGDNVILVGTRKIEDEEQSFMNLAGIKTLDVEEIRFDSARALRRLREFIFGKYDESDFKTVRERGVPLPARKSAPLYVSFDVDVLDSSIISATGYPETGGLTNEEVARLLDVVLEGNVLGGDVVELHADKPHFDKEKELVLNIIRKMSGQEA